MFEIKGYAFIHEEDEVHKIELRKGFFVNSWQEARDFLEKEHKITHYLITLEEVK